MFCLEPGDLNSLLCKGLFFVNSGSALICDTGHIVLAAYFQWIGGYIQ